MVTELSGDNETDTISKSRLRLWIKMLRASRRIEADIRNRLRREFNETLPRFDVMAALHRKPEGMIMSELSRFLMVSNGNVTGIVDRLVKDDLVARSQRDGDRRSWIIRLTAKGLENFENMAAIHEQWIDELMVNYSKQEADAFDASLSRLNMDWQSSHEKSD